MRAKASEDTKDDVDFIKKMAYDAQNMILDIEKRIQAKDAPPRKQDAIIIPIESTNYSPNKGNKSANRAVAPQQQQQQKLAVEVKKVLPTQRRESEPPVDKRAKEEDDRKKREEAKKQFAQNQKKNNKGFVEILGVAETHDD